MTLLTYNIHSDFLTVDYIEQQPLIGVRELFAIRVLVLQVQLGRVEAQTQAGHLEGEGGSPHWLVRRTHS